MARILDIIVSLFALVILSPIFLLIGLLIRFETGSPVLFKQERPGLYAKPFIMYKFRTITNEYDENGEVFSNEMGTTPLGQILRRLSLDEFPQLWNVLCGEMSLVGPRPLLMDYLPLYNDRQVLRHEVRPGVTGWSQINGRNSKSWEEKFEYDVWYVENRSFWLDIKILFLTIIKVVKSEGVNKSSTSSMEMFTGKDKAPLEE
ncbi:sugar transferase [Sporosarcina sp. FA9]|uniref:sugar transferase n=1 Tax=Sporosarcina sp. FA9 TaxID=3413030 RepID=UPI003F65CDDE